MANIPQPDEVVPELKSVLRAIHSSLEHGTMRAREFFENEDEGQFVDRYLAPCLVRYWAKNYLQSAGHEVSSEEDTADYNMQRLPNNGLCLQYGRYRLRILKSDNGEPPVPGQSLSRQQFYQQLSLLLVSSDGVEIQDDVLNLLVLWEISSPYQLSSLCLVCPRNGKDTRASVEIHWQVPIEHPAFTIAMNANATEDQGEDNLPLKLKSEGFKAEEG